MKTQTITIVGQRGKGALQVQATVIGPLSVYHRINGKGELCNEWVVGHVATGWRVTGIIKSRARALRIAKALLCLDWDFRSPRSSKVKAMYEQVKWVIDCTV